VSKTVGILVTFSIDSSFQVRFQTQALAIAAGTPTVFAQN
jgi:hypothetical protein